LARATGKYGLALNGYLWRPFVPYFFVRANNDFVSTYSGAVLAGSSGLYTLDASRRIEMRLGAPVLRRNDLAATISRLSAGVWGVAGHLAGGGADQAPGPRGTGLARHRIETALIAEG
jgi:hypothetical protein